MHKNFKVLKTTEQVFSPENLYKVTIVIVNHILTPLLYSLFVCKKVPMSVTTDSLSLKNN